MSGKITSLETTTQTYDRIIRDCRDIFINKNKDYGTSWRVLRVSSILDQIFIKATRIRTLEEKGYLSKVNEGVIPEYQGIINYAFIALIQQELGSQTEGDVDIGPLSVLYDQWALNTKELMLAKNHDYGEAWRQMQISTFTDMILMRILRIRQIIENQGRTILSEGVNPNLQDMINYAIFAIIRLEETSKDHE